MRTYFPKGWVDIGVSAIDKVKANIKHHEDYVNSDPYKDEKGLTNCNDFPGQCG